MKKLVLSLALPLAVLSIAGPVAAQIVVLGDGRAQSCYRSAKFGDQGSTDALKTCAGALKDALPRRDKAATYVNRGVLLMRKGDNEAAIEDYENALALKPDLPEAYINYAASLFFVNRDDEAMEAIETAMGLGTERLPEALFNRSLIHDRRGDYRAAYNDLTRALELKPNWKLAKDARARYAVRRKTPAT